MNTSSRKAKGRRLQQEIRDLLRETYKDNGLVDGDIESTIMGESGRDIKLSPLAESIIPFDVEAKNQETASIWSWMAQAEKNTKKDRVPLVVFKRNRSKTYAVLELKDLLQLVNKKT